MIESPLLMILFATCRIRFFDRAQCILSWWTDKNARFREMAPSKMVHGVHAFICLINNPQRANE